MDRMEAARIKHDAANALNELYAVAKSPDVAQRQETMFNTLIVALTNQTQIAEMLAGLVDGGNF